MTSSPSFFCRLPYTPEPFHLKLVREFPLDPSPIKKTYLFGSFRGEDSGPFVMPEVKQAEVDIANEDEEGKETREEISDKFCHYAQELLLGRDSDVINAGRVVSVHCNGNGNGIRVVLDFLNFALETDTLYIPAQTWLTHDLMGKTSGFKNVRRYKYWEPNGRCLDFDGLMDDLSKAPRGAVVILQPCGHNPTGMDPTKDQWRKIATFMKKRDLFPFFDTAYQGFVSGDPDEDAWSVRHFVSEGMEVAATQSFSKNFCLYSERVGNIVVVFNKPDVTPQAKDKLLQLSRGFSHFPPDYGARIVVKIMEDPERRRKWEDSLRKMVKKIRSARVSLRNKLESLTGNDWSHITDQCGMFSYTGITQEQAIWMKEEKKVYIYDVSGRMNISALAAADVDYVAQSMAEAIKRFPN